MRALLFLSLLVAVPRIASAVTVEQIIALKKAGVTDAVVLALIERDRTVFSIQPDEIVTLKREGLSEAIIIAMLKSGQAGEDAARAESAYTSAMLTAAMTTAPDLLIIGHGPDRPNTAHRDGFFTSGAPSFFIPPFGSYGGGLFPSYGRYTSPYDVPFGSAAKHLRIDRERWTQPRALCYAQMSTSASGANALSYVTECPPVLHPRRGKPLR